MICMTSHQRPRLVFAADASRFARTLTLDDVAGVEAVAARTGGARRPVTPLRELEAASADAAVDAAHAAVGPDTLAKILFTSGSTAAPKGVLTTHGMICVNQTQIRQVWPFLDERPPQMAEGRRVAGSGKPGRRRLRRPAHRDPQPVLYSCDLKVRWLVTAGRSAILRMLPQVCL